MVKIKKYIEKFFSRISIPGAYDMTQKEWVELANSAESVSMAFLFGYAKGYRACAASVRKGGDAA